MGVSVDTGGKGGRGKTKNFDLNLVPFIDLLSAIITFLISTAVWLQMSSMNVDQEISPPNAEEPPPDKPPLPPLTIHIRSDGVAVLRKIEEMKNFPSIGEGEYDWIAIEEVVKTDRETNPEEFQVVIVTDDGVHYEHMIHSLDISRTHGFDKTLLGGGPASTNMKISAPVPGAPAPAGG